MNLTLDTGCSGLNMEHLINKNSCIQYEGKNNYSLFYFSLLISSRGAIKWIKKDIYSDVEQAKEVYGLRYKASLVVVILY